MKKRLFPVLSIVVILSFVVIPHVVAAPAAITVTPIVLNQAVITYDGGHGNTNNYKWAVDHMNRTITISPYAPGKYQVAISDSGWFETLTGDSPAGPAGDGALSAGIIGSVIGNYSFVIQGSLNPGLVSQTLPPVDKRLDAYGNSAPYYTPLLNFIFQEGWSYDYSLPMPYSWTFTATCNNGLHEWVDASSNNDGIWPDGGNITGTPAVCPSAAEFVQHPFWVFWIIQAADGHGPCWMWIWDGGSPSSSPEANMSWVCRPDFVGKPHPSRYVYGTLNGMPAFLNESGVVIYMDNRPPSWPK